MAYNDMISRANTRALEADQTIIADIIKGITAGSCILPLATKLPNMTGKQAKIPVLNLLPDAYWVAGDNGLKQTTSAAWKGKYLNAEEIAVVIPIPEAVLNDADYDIWGELRPKIIEAIYKKVDEVIITGTGKPAGFPEGLIESIINAGGSVAPSTDNLYTQISKAMGKVEADGFDVNAILGGVTLKQAFRDGLVDTTGQPLGFSEITALTRAYANNGAWNNTLAKFIVGDFKQLVYAIRQDIEFKLFDSGVVTDNNNAVIYNLLQQDMVALRVTMRFAWQLPNPTNAINNDETTRFPFALVEPASAPTTYNVVFTVNDGASPTPAARNGAFVEMDGMILKTNSSGQATFKSLGSKTYKYAVTYGGKTVEGTKAVATSNTTVTVVI